MSRAPSKLAEVAREARRVRLDEWEHAATGKRRRR